MKNLLQINSSIVSSGGLSIFFKQKTAYEIVM